MPALLRGPLPVHPVAHDRRIDVEKRLANRPHKGEIALKVAAVEIIEKNAAGAARLIAMRQVEIVVAPFFEARVALGIVADAGGGERPVKGIRGIGIGIDRGQIGADDRARLGLQSAGRAGA